ncbi:MAG: DUF1302 family protein [Parvibaculales bacterium]
MKNLTLTLAALSVAATGGVAYAEPSFSITGMLRQEIAANTGDANRHTSWGSIWNGRANTSHMRNLDVLPAPYAGLPEHNTTRANVKAEENDWNQWATRLEIDVQGRLSENLSMYMKMRGYAENPQDDFLRHYDNFGKASLANGVDHPEPGIFAGGAMGSRVFRNTPLDDGYGSALENNGQDYMLDLPALYLDYNSGPVWLRVGNQQIAWGEALFFRVFDVVQGLDLRRHSVLGVAAEEYSDSRIPSPAIRGSYRFDNGWELEGYAQQFRPSILPRPGTPYSLVFEAFTVYEEPGYAQDEDDIDVGFRYSGQWNDIDLSFMAVSRTNPDGTYRWARNELYPSTVDPDNGNGTGAPQFGRRPGLAFAPDPLGTASADEWFWGASWARFNPITTLDTSVSEAPFVNAALAAGAFSPTVRAAELNAENPGTTTAELLAKGELDMFFNTNPLVGFGPLRGYLHRDYDEEVIVGASAKYVFQGAPDSFTDQLILGVEATFTQDRQFTAPSLSQTKIEEDEFSSVVSLEKYHKFSAKFPATYLVAQWMHKSESDMFGRHLSGNGSNDATGGAPTGDDQFNAVAFAVQQPFPNLIWRADLSILYDLEGGILAQPGVKWRPRDDFQLDLYANIIDSDGGNDDIMGTLETMDEIFLRASYYF